MPHADVHDMSDLSRLLDDVYQNGPATPAAPRPAAPAPRTPVPAAEPVAPRPEAAAPRPEAAQPVPPAPDPDLAWASDESMEEAFADWVPGPGAGSPAAERELFALADDEPASPSVLDHVFAADDAPAPGGLAQAMADELGDVDPFEAVDDDLGDPTQPMSALTDLFDEPAPAPAPAPAPVAEVPDRPLAAPAAPAATAEGGTALATHPAVSELPAAGATRVQAAPLAYEPPATLAEALLEAPDAPPADLAREADRDWPIAGLAPAAAPVGTAEAGVLATSWRRAHDDLLPARGRRRR